MLPDDCKNCNKEKTIFFTQIVDGKIKKFDLCADCPYAQAVNDPAGFGLAEQLTAAGVQMDEQQTGDGGKTCPNCGFSMADFKKTGRLGCSECYEVFHDALTGVLKPMHRGLKHVGRVPAHLEEELNLASRISELRGNLEKAVESEDYEQAAELRDQLRDCEERMDGLQRKQATPAKPE